MQKAARDFGAISESAVLLEYFKGFPDPRQLGKVVYPHEVLLLCLLAVPDDSCAPLPQQRQRRDKA